MNAHPSPLSRAERAAFQASEVVLVVPKHPNPGPSEDATGVTTDGSENHNQRTLLLYGE